MSGPRICCVACGTPTDTLFSQLCALCAVECEEESLQHSSMPRAAPKGSDQHVGKMIGYRAILAGVIVPPAPSGTCPTCSGVGLIGGPSYREPDEGGAPCPDCAVKTDDWWRVEVSDSAGQIVGIESGTLAGREIGEREEATIRLAIEYLRGLIGKPAQTPDHERGHEDSRELRRLCEHRDHLKRELAELRQQRDDMVVDVARSSPDAERYRFIRDSRGNNSSIGIARDGVYLWLQGEEADTAIDSARQKESSNA